MTGELRSPDIQEGSVTILTNDEAHNNTFIIYCRVDAIRLIYSCNLSDPGWDDTLYEWGEANYIAQRVWCRADGDGI